ncbi:MAG TPA: hypothetical protein VFW71_16250 [Actinomycetota bacterium]|nr:hypothetical protein [Actinomycetota bacterium]
MFGRVVSFEEESPEDMAAGISHVEEEVLVALRDAPGLTGVWLVDREARRRLSIMVWESEEQAEAAFAKLNGILAQDPDRHRPKPASRSSWEVYGLIK